MGARALGQGQAEQRIPAGKTGGHAESRAGLGTPPPGHSVEGTLGWPPSGPQLRTETREGTQSIKKQLFTVEMQPRCSTHRILSLGQREGGRPGPGPCPPPTRTQPCCWPVHAVGDGRSLGARDSRLCCSSSSARRSARLTAACNTPPCAQAPAAGPSPGRRSHRPGPTSCCFRRLLTASSFFAKAIFTLQESMLGFGWVPLQIPGQPAALGTAGWPVGASTPRRVAEAAVLASLPLSC